MKILDRLPITEERTSLRFGDRSITVRSSQVLVWMSVHMAGVLEPEESIPKFPALLDTGNYRRPGTSPLASPKSGSPGRIPPTEGTAMPVEIALSENAVAVLRFEIKGWKAKNKESRLPAYRELAAAGIMEPVPDSETDYRFTEDGMKCREDILDREGERIERERYEPPDASNLSEAARELLRRHLAGDDEVTDSNRDAYRELAIARVMIPLSGFATGPESRYIFTYWGWCMRFDLAEMACTKGGA